MARMNPRREKTEDLRMRDWMEERRLRGNFVRLFSPNIFLHFYISFAEFEIPYLKLVKLTKLFVLSLFMIPSSPPSPHKRANLI